jgi:hypothetical protein
MAFSELACLKNKESLNLPLLKICVKIISLPKNKSQSLGVEVLLLFFERFFGKLTILTQTLRNGRFKLS